MNELIFFRIENENDWIKSQNLSFRLNYGWGFKKKTDIRKYENRITCLVFNPSTKRLTYLDSSLDNYLKQYLDYNDVLNINIENVVDKLDRLDFLLSGKKIINYNKPKQLIYD